MTGYFLERVQLEGFRGINNENDPLDIKFDVEKVNSVFGRNGLGKSSVFEAVIYAIKSVVPKLECLPKSEKSSEYYCNRFHSAKTARIILTFTDENRSDHIDIKVELDNLGQRNVTSPTGHHNVSDLLSKLDNDTSFLDYQTFEKFVSDSPLDRGRTFSSLLGLSKVV